MHGNEIRDRIATLLDSQDEILRGAKGDRLAQRDAAQYDRNDAEIRQLERDLLTAPGQDEYGQSAPKPGETARGFNDGRENRLGNWLAGEIRGWVGTGTTNGGSFTPTGFWADFWDLLASASVGLQSGFTRIQTDKVELVIPHLTADTTSGWYSEAQTISSTDATAAQVTATPRKLAALQALSNEVIADSNPAVLDVVGRSMVRSIGLKFDLGVFEGSGTPPEITGLKNVGSIQTVSMGTNGAQVTNLDPFADAIGLLEAATPRRQRSLCTHGRGRRSSS